MRWDKIRPKTLEKFKRVEAAVTRGQDLYLTCKNVGLSANWFNKISAAKKEIVNDQKAP